MSHSIKLSFIIAILSAIQVTHAVTYSVTNRVSTTPGGVPFTNQIGVEYSRQTLISATDLIWRTFAQTNTADTKSVSAMSLFIDDMDGVGYTTNNEVHISSRYIQSYSRDVKREITGGLYHEMTHVWQWFGDGKAVPGGLIEGIADYVRLKSVYAPSNWVRPGQGDRWDQGYDVTARFLDYCNCLRVAELNKKMRGGYSNNYFVDLLGKSPEQLFSEYKARPC